MRPFMQLRIYLKGIKSNHGNGNENTSTRSMQMSYAKEGQKKRKNEIPIFVKISFGSSVEQNLKKVDLKHSTNHDNRHKNRSSPRRWINQKRKRIKIVCGCSLTWHQWLLGRISNCRRATDLAKDHPVAPALRFAGNLTYNRFVSQL